MYEIAKKPAEHRVEIVFDGPHDYDYLVFAAELREAALFVRSTGGHFDLLVDFSKGQVLPPENAKQSQDNIAWCIANGMRKSANIVTSVTQRMQVKRVSANDDRLNYFRERSDAEAWLAQ